MFNKLYNLIELLGGTICNISWKLNKIKLDKVFFLLKTWVERQHGTREKRKRHSYWFIQRYVKGKIKSFFIHDEVRKQKKRSTKLHHKKGDFILWMRRKAQRRRGEGNRARSENYLSWYNIYCKQNEEIQLHK